MKPGSFPRNILIHSSFILSMKDSFQNWCGANTRLQSLLLQISIPTLTVPPTALQENSLEYSRRKKNSLEGYRLFIKFISYILYLFFPPKPQVVYLIFIGIDGKDSPICHHYLASSFIYQPTK